MMNRDLLELAKTDNVSDLPLFRALGDIPRTDDSLVRVVNAPPPPRNGRGQTYEEANWDKLSPHYREAHNRLRKARGQQPIPPPKVDNYRPPEPKIRAFDPTDREALAAARAFMGTPIMGPRGSEGFSVPAKVKAVIGDR